MRKRKGDTLIEVMLAVGVFSMIAIAVVSIMNSGTSGTQTTLETTLAREEIDTQAEALRFIQSAYIADMEAKEEDSEYVTLWKDITAKAIDSDEDLNPASAPTNCRNIYNDATFKKYAFILDPNAISDPSKALIDFSKTVNNSKYNIASTYPRLIYNQKQANNKDNLASNYTGNLYRAEGIYIIAVRDQDSTSIIGFTDENGNKVDEGTALNQSVFYDFYIRTCWYGISDDKPTSIATVIRLYDPATLSELAANNIRGTVLVNYFDYEPTLNPIGQANPPKIDEMGYKVQVYNGKTNLTRKGYTFSGWCSGTVTRNNSADDSCGSDGRIFGTDSNNNQIKNPNEGIAEYNLKPLWSRNRYTINYNPDGGSWENESWGERTVSTTCYETNENGSVYNTCHINPGSELTRSGYRFKGWCQGDVTDGVCSGTKYENGDVINPFTNSKKGEINLKAIWSMSNEKITIYVSWTSDSDYDSHMQLQKPDSDGYISANYGTRNINVTFNGQTYSLITGEGDGRGSINKIYHENFEINTLGGKNYYYSIRKYPSGDIGNDITITVAGNTFKSSERTNGSGTCNGNYWNVFAYKNGRIVKRNTCSAEMEYGY